MIYSQLREALKKSVEPVYQLVGSDFFVINSAFNEILLSAGIVNPEFNLAKFGGDATIGEIISSCNQFSFFSERKVIYAEYLKIINSADKILWSKYLENPNPQACLIISSETPTGLTGGVTVDCNPLDDSELMVWIKERTANEGKTISNKNALTLIKYTRGNMSSLNGEMHKLFSYAENEITADAIEALVLKNEEYEIYELANRTGQKDAEGALSVLGYLLSHGKEPTSLLITLYNTFRKLFYISLNKELTNDELANYLGGKAYGTSKLREMAAKFSPARLLKSISLCLAAEYDLKTSSADKACRLELLILSLINC